MSPSGVGHTAQDCGNRHQHHAELTGVFPLPLINLLTLCECLSPCKLQFLTCTKGTDAVGAAETTGGHTPRAHVHISTCSCGRGAHPGPAPGPMSSLAPIMHLSALRLLCCGRSREVPHGFQIVSKNSQSLCGYLLDACSGCISGAGSLCTPASAGRQKDLIKAHPAQSCGAARPMCMLG